ncbi:MAG TPA: SH3 domain-containing protein [Pseudorhodoferax sp.]|jgi:SH3-like domain-containing protein|nr:SH3 domain-containing protein [Pseudorhodoferax sp.]
MSIAFPTLLRILVAAFALLAGAAWAQQYVSITAREANMRSGPGTQHAVQWSLSRGYPLQVMARRGEWLQVRDHENDSGWVHRSLTGRSTHKVVRVPVANLRAQPRANARLQGKLEHGEIVQRLARRDGWVQVQREGGQRGWVSSRLLWGG